MFKHCRRMLALLAVVAVLTLICAPAALAGGRKPKPPEPPTPPEATVKYEIQFLGVDGRAYDLNSYGEVVGYAGTGLDIHAFRVVPEDVDGDGLLEWYSDDGYGGNVLMVLLNDLIDPTEDWDLVIAYGINDGGQIVGHGYHDGEDHAFCLTPGADGEWAVVVDLGTFDGGDTSSASQINESGEVVGSSPWGSLYSRGFLWTEEGGMVDIGSLVEGARTEARGINDSGWVTGFSYVSDLNPHAFLRSPDGVMKDLGYFAPVKKNRSWRSLGYDINSDGHVVGEAGVHAFLYTDHMIDLGTLSGDAEDDSVASGLNSWDEVVGRSGPGYSGDPYSIFDYDGFLYTDKAVTPSGDPAVAMFKLQDLVDEGLPEDFQAHILPRRINDDGVICGHAGGVLEMWEQPIVLVPVSP